MDVCRNRSTNKAPVALSISYLTGTPPSGISMTAWRSLGGLRPGEMCRTSMAASIGNPQMRKGARGFASSSRRDVPIPVFRVGHDAKGAENCPALIVKRRRLLQVRISHDVVLD